MSEADMTGKCELCGTRIHYWADVCHEHAMTNAQLAEMGRRIKVAVRAYHQELWPDLFEVTGHDGDTTP